MSDHFRRRPTDGHAVSDFSTDQRFQLNPFSPVFRDRSPHIAAVTTRRFRRPHHHQAVSQSDVDAQLDELQTSRKGVCASLVSGRVGRRSVVSCATFARTRAAKQDRSISLLRARIQRDNCETSLARASQGRRASATTRERAWRESTTRPSRRTERPTTSSSERRQRGVRVSACTVASATASPLCGRVCVLAVANRLRRRCARPTRRKQCTNNIQ